MKTTSCVSRTATVATRPEAPDTRRHEGNALNRCRDSVIILTGGLSGSSALAGLLSAAITGRARTRSEATTTPTRTRSRSGSTAAHAACGGGGRLHQSFAAKAIDDIAALTGRARCRVSRAGGRCDPHAPWLWKDPRLWLTSAGRHCCRGRASACCCWVATRCSLDCARSAARSRPEHRGATTSRSRRLCARFEQHGIRFLPVLFEDLIVTPNARSRVRPVSRRRNLLEHLTSTYDGVLRRKPKTLAPCGGPHLPRTILSACADLVPSVHGNDERALQQTPIEAGRELARGSFWMISMRWVIRGIGFEHDRSRGCSRRRFRRRRDGDGRRGDPRGSRRRARPRVAAQCGADARAPDAAWTLRSSRGARSRCCCSPRPRGGRAFRGSARHERDPLLSLCRGRRVPEHRRRHVPARAALRPRIPVRDRQEVGDLRRDAGRCVHAADTGRS